MGQGRSEHECMRPGAGSQGSAGRLAAAPDAHRTLVAHVTSVHAADPSQTTIELSKHTKELGRLRIRAVSARGGRAIHRIATRVLKPLLCNREAIEAPSPPVPCLGCTRDLFLLRTLPEVVGNFCNDLDHKINHRPAPPARFPPAATLPLAARRSCRLAAACRRLFDKAAQRAQWPHLPRIRAKPSASIWAHASGAVCRARWA